MSQVLVIDNSKVFASLVAKKVENELHFRVKSVRSYSEAEKLLNDNNEEFFIALVGLYLHDSYSGEIVDLMLSHNIPTIVFTGKYSDEVRDKFLSKKIVDYVLKEDVHSLDYVISLIRRIKLNKSIKVLVVDDSRTVREQIAELLEVHQYQVFKADDGDQAYQILDMHPDIRLVLTDYKMPRMDGFQLTKSIRSKYSKEDVAIIGVSAKGSNKLSARFIKCGANDFMAKPFLAEEFYCRITQNIEMLEYIKASKDAANKDYLTGLYNRRYLFELGRKLHANLQRKNLTLAVAMVDIDFFKKVNDSYGHDSGDIVLQKIARILKSRFRESDIVARLGGEEFCILTTNMEHQSIFRIFDDLRENISNTAIDIGKIPFNITVSIGICDKQMDTLEKMIKEADDMLYKAKNSGRNRVMMA